MITSLEFRRQVLHILFGIALIYLINFGYLDAERIFLIIGLGLFIVHLYKKKHKVPLIHRLLHLFEREKQIQKFPGQGVVFYLLGVFTVLVLFPFEIAIASVAILAFGDAVSNIIGYNFGSIRILFKPKKSIEGTLAGIIAGFLAAVFFTTLHPVALLVASSFAMLAEIPNIKILNLPIDDNLVIPLVAGGTLNIIYFVLV